MRVLLCLLLAGCVEEIVWPKDKLREIYERRYAALREPFDKDQTEAIRLNNFRTACLRHNRFRADVQMLCNSADVEGIESECARIYRAPEKDCSQYHDYNKTNEELHP